MKTLPYAKARKRIKSGDTLFCQGSSFVSKLIRWTTGEISHVGKVFDWGSRKMVLESVEKVGTRIIPLSWYVKNYNGGLFIGRSPELDVEDALDWCQRHVPRKYDYKEIGRIALRRFRISSRDAFVSNEDFICSEFVQEADAEGGVSHAYSGRGYITPTDIWNSETVKQLLKIER